MANRKGDGIRGLRKRENTEFLKTFFAFASADEIQ
jgi:hypothetical protein